MEIPKEAFANLASLRPGDTVYEFVKGGSYRQTVVEVRAFKEKIGGRIVSGLECEVANSMAFRQFDHEERCRHLLLQPHYTYRKV